MQPLMKLFQRGGFDHAGLPATEASGHSVPVTSGLRARDAPPSPVFSGSRRVRCITSGLRVASVVRAPLSPDTRWQRHGPNTGTSGVSIATLEDMKVLFGGFDLCSPSTSVSMTINGPAPTILAYYLNTATSR